MVEKAFGRLKERLNVRRALVSSEHSLDGKLKKQRQDTDLFQSYTLQGVLDTLDVIECFEAPSHQLRVGELLEKQVELYEKLGVEPPASL